jgi:hypothetical protein
VSALTKFGDRVLFGLVFFMDIIFMVGVDEAARLCSIRSVVYRNFSSLEQVFRRGWCRQFGPPCILRVDKEKALAGERFGLYLEKIGCKRELLTAADDHGPLSILDRRVQLLRRAGPRIVDDLASEGIVAEAEDIAAELEYCLNSQLSYKGFTPYMSVYGIQPPDIRDVELDTIASHYETDHPFYRHQQIRTRCLIQFHEAITQARLDKAITG